MSPNQYNIIWYDVSLKLYSLCVCVCVFFLGWILRPFSLMNDWNVAKSVGVFWYWKFSFHCVALHWHFVAKGHYMRFTTPLFTEGSAEPLWSQVRNTIAHIFIRCQARFAQRLFQAPAEEGWAKGGVSRIITKLRAIWAEQNAWFIVYRSRIMIWCDISYIIESYHYHIINNNMSLIISYNIFFIILYIIYYIHIILS